MLELDSKVSNSNLLCLGLVIMLFIRRVIALPERSLDMCLGSAINNGHTELVDYQSTPSKVP